MAEETQPEYVSIHTGLGGWQRVRNDPNDLHRAINDQLKNGRSVTINIICVTTTGVTKEK